METFSIGEARRVALAAQGMPFPRPAGRSASDRLQSLFARLHLLQLDSVNVLARAHYLPAFSRLGPYPCAALDKLAWGQPRPLFEYWGHEASLMPLDLHPLLRWRMARAERGEGTWSGLARYATERRSTADAVLARIAGEGPLAASELEKRQGGGGWWNWSQAKAAAEWLFWAGKLAVATRRNNFERVYDLAERVIPASILSIDTPGEAEAQRRLLDLSGKALGIATAADLRDYFRLSAKDVGARISELVDEGRLREARVEGWPGTAYLHAEAEEPAARRAEALLSPFDPIVWNRARVERLLGIRYRIEIYTPAHLRVHGYYVLPFLIGDRIAARVDLKADRKSGALLVQSAHREPRAGRSLAPRLARQLNKLAAWLDLERIEVAPRGDLAPALAALIQ